MSALDDLPARLEREAAACLDVAVAFPDDAVGIKNRGKAVAFACAADWLRDALSDPSALQRVRDLCREYDNQRWVELTVGDVLDALNGAE